MVMVWPRLLQATPTSDAAQPSLGPSPLEPSAEPSYGPSYAFAPAFAPEPAAAPPPPTEEPDAQAKASLAVLTQVSRCMWHVMSASGQSECTLLEHWQERVTYSGFVAGVLHMNGATWLRDRPFAIRKARCDR